jgi:RHS repeat-associated protein
MGLQAGEVVLRVDTRGARYPLRIDPFLQQGRRLAGPPEEVSFGEKVALSANGDTALVSAPYYHPGGAVWVFTRWNSIWTLQAKLKSPIEGAELYFGESVALSADGNTAVIGSPWFGSGSINGPYHSGVTWVFTRSGTTWTEQAKLLPTVYRREGGGFGFAVGLAANGNTLVVGEPGRSNQEEGKAWVFTRSGTSWSEPTQLESGAKPETNFGGSVALSGDGNTALISGYDWGHREEYGAGAVWVFTRSGSSWSEQRKLRGGEEESGKATFGQELALSENGNTALIAGPTDDNGEPAVGAVWVFTRSGSTWSQQGKKLTEGCCVFGIRVALSADGNTALVANRSGEGQVWVLKRSGSVWSRHGEALTASEKEGDPSYGSSVALSADANTALIGDRNEYEHKEYFAGDAFVYSFDYEPGEAEYGLENPGEPGRRHCFTGDPVSCATGNAVESQTDLQVGGRGPALGVTRTYDSQLAATETSPGPFGYGWTGPYSAHLALFEGDCEGEEESATCHHFAAVHQSNGSTVTFKRSGEAWAAVSPLAQATLVPEGSSYVYTLPGQSTLKFNGSGQLTSETDRNGNALTMKYSGGGQLESVADAAGRKLAFTYNGEGRVEKVVGPMEHTVKYAYESGQLKSVTEPGEESPRWQFGYNSEHELTSLTDGRGHATTTEYDASYRAVSQTDAMSRKREWKYAITATGTETTITEPNGAVTVEQFNAQGLPVEVTHASGTAGAATTTYEYNSANELIAVTDPNKHKTEYGYDEAGNRTSEKDPDGDETKWKYDSKHDIETETTPDGETTTIKRNSAGDPEVIERPAPGSTTQKTTYKYAGNGDVESMSDPLEHTWRYEYDSYGARTAEIDPEGNKRTWGYNENSQETSAVSPRGNVSGGNPAEYKTTIERDAQGRPVKVIEPAAGQPAKPLNRTPAVISGTAQEAQTLAAATGVWEGAPSLSYSYQWEHCNSTGGSCASISGATSSTYLLGPGDVGYTMRVVVTATNTSGSATSTSEASAVVVSAVIWGYSFGSGTLHHPDGDAIDAKGRLWVTSSSGEPWLQVFSPEGEQLATYGATGTAKGDFEDSNGIAINKSTGAVYVSDGSNDRIQEFSEAGVAGKEIGKKGAGAGEFEKPVAVALDSSGDLWVADYTGQRIEEFNKEGTFLKAFGWDVNKNEGKLEVCTTTCKVGKAGTEEGELDDPAGVEYAGGYIHVVDYGDDLLQKFTTAGEYVGHSGGESELSHPGNETTEIEENSYVADAGNNRVEKFTGHGAYVDVFGTAGTGQGQFSETGDVAITPSVGELFVTDPGNNRLQKWDSTTLPAFAATIGAGDFTHPGDAAIDPKGRIWVTNSKGTSAEIQVFSSSGTREATYGEHGSEKGQYTEPDGIAINQSTSNVYVADGGAGRIDELSEKGAIIKEIGTKGTGAGQMADPVAVALDPSGDIWVADRTGQRIEEFNKEGTFVKAVGYGVNTGGTEKLEVCTTSCKEGKAGSGEGQFNDPTGIVYTDGYLHIVDAGNDRLEKFSTGGEYAGHAASAGSGNGQLSHPQGITAGPGGNEYVADAGNGRIEEFNPYGTFVAAFGTAGSSGSQFNEPTGLAVGASEEIYVADAENNRVEKWLPAASPVNTVPPTVSGELIVGQALSASSGSWSALPAASYSYQWQRCNSTGESCSNISGAISASYTLASGDEGHTLRVVVTATNSLGSAAGTSPATSLLAPAPTTEYHYDADGNVESVTDPNGHTASYTYDNDNELTKTKEPNGTVTEAEYDAMGQIKSQTDGNKHATEYKRNPLEEVEEEVNPLGKKTFEEYNAAGSLVKLTDPKKRTTTYIYDAANRLTELSYSGGTPATVKYEYNKDGDRTKMTDGTGTTKYEYDQLDRLTESENGHKEVSKYEYNLGNKQTKITYPNSKAVTRGYDKDERLEKVTDWLEHTTKFAYDPDSDLTTTSFPSETKDEDKYAYNHDDQANEVTMLKSTEALASLAYARDSDGQVTDTAGKGLPGEEAIEDHYDENNRLTKGGSTEYKYDAANNPTKVGASEDTYNAADQLEEGTAVTYSYDELGERTKTKPTSGPATTYGYDQASDLTSVERPKEGATAEINDAYAYNGERLRVSQTIAGTTTYMAWDTTEELPLLLSDGTNSYIYGPNGLPFEQISSGGTVTYLHHDQAGSTRLLTGSTGTVTGKCTYSSYGTPTCEGASTTPLEFDAQYTSTDTGLIYLRNRVYDPTTAQFLTVDPAVAITREPYAYGGDNPVNRRDPDGVSAEGLEGVPCYFPFCGPPPPAVEGVQHGIEGITHGIESVWNEVNENEGPNDEGEAALKDKEAERENACDPTPPGYDPETWTKGPASRAKEPDENYYDPEGGEWHYHAPDRHHEVPHWDYKRLPGKLAPWEEIPIE